MNYKLEKLDDDTAIREYKFDFYDLAKKGSTWRIFYIA